MIGRINPYSVYPSYNNNKTTSAIKANPIDSVTFKGFSKELPKPVVDLAHEVLAKMNGGSLEVPSIRCKAMLGSSGSSNSLNRFFLRTQENDKFVRYQLEILPDSDVIVPSSGIAKELLPKEEAVCGGVDIPLDEQSVYEKAVSAVKDLLTALKDKGETQRGTGFGAAA